ncbi:hypothetical protein O181_090473 [Austropuccinia psidii MF-1]|uniref:Uncharacterized protein n=1 Tax=Austropuccinia psidii MF-1 TaxID=1389203 RepID=A0A9Q3P6J1_9BASI|nr:hypothetical protein [Austropuccinia psidii MF-1]
MNGARAYTPPICVLKFWFDKAGYLKNVEALTGGKSDPYVRLMRSGTYKAVHQLAHRVGGNHLGLLIVLLISRGTSSPIDCHRHSKRQTLMAINQSISPAEIAELIHVALCHQWRKATWSSLITKRVRQTTVGPRGTIIMSQSFSGSIKTRKLKSSRTYFKRHLEFGQG